MALTKDQILGSPVKLRIEQLPVPEWGDGAEVSIRELTGDERDAYDQIVVKQGDNYRGLRAHLVAMSLCDESGKPLGFTEAEVKQLGGKSGAAIDRIFQAAQRLSGLAHDSQEQAAKNSKSDQSESSG